MVQVSGTTKPIRDVVPLLPLRGVIVFPSTTVPLEIGRDKSIAALDNAMINNKLIMLASQKQARLNKPDPDDIFAIGTLSEIRQLAKYPDGTIRVIIQGVGRAEILEYMQMEPFFKVKIKDLPIPVQPEEELETLMKDTLNYFGAYLKSGKKAPKEVFASIQLVDNPGRLADEIASYLPLCLEDKQSILEAVSAKARLKRLCRVLLEEIEITELEEKINIRVRRQVEKTQKEYYLREQMKAIQRELGEYDEKQSEIDEYREKIADRSFPDEVKGRIILELERLEKLPPMAAEASVIRTYIDWLFALPWSLGTQDCPDMVEAAKILDEDHYALEGVKERIMEFLAVRRLTCNSKGPILCFVGPPGVGKTSLGKSIARALRRRLIRFSLGGIKDEAEIRGHRRTYVGALPGRVIRAMRQAGTKNPVILLDEIDKIGNDFRGDPASALLEVLDPEQNMAFNDHYIEIPYDLSDVMFITTANLLCSIPNPLLDRMEVITLPGYTEEEKIQIGKRFLIPKQRKENGLYDHSVSITDSALKIIVRNYTREAGVRGLERNISSIFRKIARRIVTENPVDFKITIDGDDVFQYLGAAKYRYGMKESEDKIGVATGLAVTEAGGDILAIEVSVMKGTGKLILTGKLGDVMKESAQAAFTYIRSRSEALNIDPGFHQYCDVHIHVPEGAIPKDGPSAGTAITVALASALTGTAVRCDVAMTGEITLRGRILAVGGIKEKILAAHRAGLSAIIIPVENKKDVRGIASYILDGMKLIFASNLDEILDFVLGKGTELPLQGNNSFLVDPPDVWVI
ncbi:MAG: endopeptidase La [Firmicutes bacterium]|nr:endopeptidase La [Bacillota bacterium]